MQHEVIILLAYHLLETHKQIDYSKFVPTILSRLHSKNVLTADFIKQWAAGELDETLCQHFLFSREFNEKLKEMGKSFVDYLKAEEEESEDEESDSESKSDSSKSESSDGDSDGDN